jgi:centromeric protein E
MQMDHEVKELKQQLDLAQSQVDNRQQSDGEDRVLRIRQYPVSESFNTSKDFNRADMLNSSKHYLQLPEVAEENFLMNESTPEFFGPDPHQGWEEIAQRANTESEDNCKEVRCIEVEESRMDKKIGPEEKVGQLPLREVMNEDAVTSTQKGTKETISDDAIKYPLKGPKAMKEDAVSYPQKQTEKVMNEDAVSSLENEAKELGNANVDYTYDDLKQKIMSMQKAINCLISFCPSDQSPCSSEGYMPNTGGLKLVRSRSCKPNLMTMPSYHCSEKTERNRSTIPPGLAKDFPGRPEGSHHKIVASKFGANIGNLSRKSSQDSFTSDFSESQNSDNYDSDDTRSILSFATGSNISTSRPKKKSVRKQNLSLSLNILLFLMQISCRLTVI